MSDKKQSLTLTTEITHSATDNPVYDGHFLGKLIKERTMGLMLKNEQLKRSEELYCRMVEEIVDYAILLLDVNGIVQNWNLGAEKIKGYKEEEIVGKHFSHFYLKEDRDNNLPQKLLDEASRTGRAAHEGWRLRKDGTTFWGNIVITALHDSNNNIVGFSKVTRDLSERKAAEDKIQQYTRHLEFQNKELEEFAYATSHDLKEPLRKIHYYNSYVIDHCADKLDETSRNYLLRSMAAVSRMSQLIDDILAYTRQTEDAEQKQDVDLNIIVSDILQHNKDELINNKVTVSIIRTLPTVKAVGYQVGQVFDNLISNSIKYRNPDRPCQIIFDSAEVGKKDIENVLGLKSERYHAITIRDNGLGFEQQFNEKIFELFKRLHGRNNYSGSGIGLAICKKIMQNHDGLIKAEGEPDKGACFTLYFPI